MGAPAVWRPPRLAWPLLGVLALLAVWKLQPAKLEGHWQLATPILIAFGVLALRYLWEQPPAVTMCGAVALSVFSGAWGQIGLGNIPLNRVLALLVVCQCLLRAPGTVGMPRLQLRSIHLLMALTLLYAIGSAAAAGTLGGEKGFLGLWDTLGVMPYLLFLIAPAVFHGRREREMLLITLLGLGAYLGLTAIFEIVGPRSLVFPRYIVTSDSITPGVLRAGGPFQSAVAEGCATYVCAVAAAIAFNQWQGQRRRWLAAAAGLAALAGCFLTLERGVWLAALLASVVVALGTRTGRRLLVPALVAGALLLGGALAVSSTLSSSAGDRANDQRSVWDRETQIGAGLRMVEAKPLLGFGWNRYAADSGDYFRQPFDYPMSGYLPGTLIGTAEVPQPLHSTYLAYAVELGLLGALLWLASLLWAVGEGIFARGPTEMRAWKLGLAAVALFVLAVIAVNPHEPPFAFMIVMVWAGVALAGRERRRRPAGVL
ncbi:MAG: O-antigen ligase family protein [Solirubrobacterales bacterium]